MLEAPARDEGARLGQRLDDGVVGVALVAFFGEDALAGEAGRVLGQHAVGVDSEGDRRVDAALFQLGGARHPDLVVVGTVAGGGVHEAGAGILGNVVALEEGHLKIIAKRCERMRGNDPDLGRRQSRPLRNLNPLSIFAAFLTSSTRFVGNEKAVPLFAQFPSGEEVTSIRDIVDLRRETHRAIARESSTASSSR